MLARLSHSAKTCNYQEDQSGRFAWFIKRLQIENLFWLNNMEEFSIVTHVSFYSGIGNLDIECDLL